MFSATNWRYSGGRQVLTCTPNVSQVLLPELIKILGWRDFGWYGAPFSSIQSCVNTWNRTSATVIFGISKQFGYFLMPVCVEIRHRYSFYIPKIKSNSPRVKENVVLTICDSIKVIKVAASVFFSQLFFPLSSSSQLAVLKRFCYFRRGFQRGFLLQRHEKLCRSLTNGNRTPGCCKCRSQTPAPPATLMRSWGKHEHCQRALKCTFFSFLL